MFHLGIEDRSYHDDDQVELDESDDYGWVGILLAMVLVVALLSFVLAYVLMQKKKKEGAEEAKSKEQEVILQTVISFRETSLPMGQLVTSQRSQTSCHT